MRDDVAKLIEQAKLYAGHMKHERLAAFESRRQAEDWFTQIAKALEDAHRKPTEADVERVRTLCARLIDRWREEGIMHAGMEQLDEMVETALKIARAFQEG
ncbi:MAG: hypothetical protein GY906_24110 [bacterium]|nr:hypothetical protein [bacterium]